MTYSEHELEFTFAKKIARYLLFFGFEGIVHRILKKLPVWH